MHAYVRACIYSLWRWVAQNWDTLRDGPAPYKPDSADDMSVLLESVKHVAATDPEMPRLVKKITANFDDFKEVCTAF